MLQGRKDRLRVGLLIPGLHLMDPPTPFGGIIGIKRTLISSPVCLILTIAGFRLHLTLVSF